MVIIRSSPCSSQQHTTQRVFVCLFAPVQFLEREISPISFHVSIPKGGEKTGKTLFFLHTHCKCIYSSMTVALFSLRWKELIFGNRTKHRPRLYEGGTEFNRKFVQANFSLTLPNVSIIEQSNAKHTEHTF